MSRHYRAPLSRYSVVGPAEGYSGQVLEILVVGSSHVRRMLGAPAQVQFHESVQVRYVGVGSMRLPLVRRFLETGKTDVNGTQVTWGNPDAVVIATSGNDIKEGQDTSSYLNAYAEIAQRIISRSTKNPRVSICYPMYRLGAGFAGYNRVVRRIFSRDSAMSRVYRQVSPAWLIKLNLTFYKSSLSGDKIHLTPAGYVDFRKDIDNHVQEHMVRYLLSSR